MLSATRALQEITDALEGSGGRFTLVHRHPPAPGRFDDNPWLASMEWGQEAAPDSDMAGAAAYGMGATAAEAIDAMLGDAGR